MRSPHPRHFHAVQFYTDNASLTSVVSGFLAEGFACQQPGVLIATPEHCAAIEDALAGRRLDVKRLKQLGDLVVLDARETLDTFMVDGMPHEPLFRDVATRMLDEMVRIHPNTTIRAYGEMVNLLWSDGFTAAAIRLETLWNELARSYEFQLLCGYSMRNFYKDAAIGEITRHHSHLIVEDGEAATIN